jgi:XTP/dITP diphosphohydrolase
VTRVYVATKNAGKMRELREIFAGTSLAVETYDDYVDVVEGESSYAENAALKARALRAQLEGAGISAAVLGDDSGLEVRALGNRPGVLSARYGGPSASWSERRLGLIGELAATGSSERSARFVCALFFIDADGRETATLETIDGEISPSERGEAGFSYDPIFLLPERGVTFAELPAEEKNRISHRARAAAALLAALESAAAEPEPAPSGGN